MVALMIASRLSVQGVNKSRQVGNDNQSFAVAATDLTANELRICRKHKRSR
jgi:hypothetical protein